MSSILVIALGSKNDLKQVKMSGIFDILDEILGREKYTIDVISADRNADQMPSWCTAKLRNGAEVFLGIAGMINVLAGSIAANLGYSRPVIAVGLESDFSGGLDTLLSMVRKPAGVATLTTGVGKAALINAALQSCAILGNSRPPIREKLFEHFEKNHKKAEFNINPDEIQT